MASETEGVKSFSIQGRLYRERERLLGMTDEERAWRANWVKDQILSPCEPKEVPALYKELKNPIRRLYQAPLNILYGVLKPVMGSENAMCVRLITGKAIMGLALIYSGWYYFKYNANNWTRKGGWRVVCNRPTVCLGEPGYPLPPSRNYPDQYATRGFDQSPI